MKNVPIKFRGVRLDGNGFAYGDLTHNGRETWIGGWQVRPDTVAQLCGYDADAREVYEGDALYCYHFGKFNCTSTVKLTATVEVFYRDEDLNVNFDYKFRLKGAHHDD